VTQRVDPDRDDDPSDNGVGFGSEAHDSPLASMERVVEVTNPRSRGGRMPWMAAPPGYALITGGRISS
jgi:hypothetical protein